MSGAALWHRGFLSWWYARDAKQSYNDEMLFLVHEEWAKYVQKVDYWGGHVLHADFAFPGGLRLWCISVYASPVHQEVLPMLARLCSVLASASAMGYQVILAGDLNGVFNPACDRVPSGSSGRPDTALMRLLAHQDLIDVFHMIHPREHSLQSMTRINPADSSSGN